MDQFESTTLLSSTKHDGVHVKSPGQLAERCRDRSAPLSAFISWQGAGESQVKTKLFHDMTVSGRKQPRLWCVIHLRLAAPNKSDVTQLSAERAKQANAAFGVTSHAVHVRSRRNGKEAYRNVQRQPVATCGHGARGPFIRYGLPRLAVGQPEKRVSAVSSFCHPDGPYLAACWRGPAHPPSLNRSRRHPPRPRLTATIKPDTESKP